MIESDAASLSEVVRSAEILTAPLNHEGLAQQVIALVGDEDLRSCLAEMAQERCQGFLGLGMARKPSVFTHC